MKERRKEFIKKAHSAACSEWKTNIEAEFPELFKKDDLVIGNWYKVVDPGHHIKGLTNGCSFLQIEDLDNLSIIKKADKFLDKDRKLIYNNHLFGHTPSGEKVLFGSDDPIKGLIPATDDEVKQAFIKESINKGFKKGVFISNDSIGYCYKGICSSNEITFKNGVLAIDGIIILENGVWATIVEETITKEEAKIITDKIEALNNELLNKTIID